MSTLAPLAQIAADVATLRRLLASDEEAPAGVDREDLTADLDRYLAVDLAQKCDAYASVIRELDANHERLKRWQADLGARRKTIEAQKQSMMDRLLAAMDALGVRKLEGEASCFVALDSTPSVSVTDEAALPLELLKVVPATSRPDKAAIARLLKRGEAVPGAVLVKGRHVKRTL